jgi:hypothetical protein
VKIIKERIYENRGEEGKATLKELAVHGVTLKLLTFTRTTQLSAFKTRSAFEHYVQVVDRDRMVAFEVEGADHGARVLADLELAIDFRHKQRLISRYREVLEVLD